MNIKQYIIFSSVLFATNAFAADTLDLSLSPDPLFVSQDNNSPYTQLASAEDSHAVSTMGTQNQEPFEESWLTWNKTHQYLGLGSLALAGVAALLPKPEEHGSEEDIESSWHHRAALGAAYLGGAAVASGVAFHYKDIRWSKFFKDPDALHATLATLATTAFVLSVANAPEESHATAGMAGIFTMAAAIKITW
jgi:hypothetical protein